MQTPGEHQHDQRINQRNDTTISVSNDDLSETDIDRMRDGIDGERGNPEKE